MHIEHDGKIIHTASPGEKYRLKVPVHLSNWVSIGPNSWTQESFSVEAGTVLTYIRQSYFGSDPGPGFPVFKTEDGRTGELVQYSDWDRFPFSVIELVV